MRTLYDVRTYLHTFVCAHICVPVHVFAYVCMYMQVVEAGSYKVAYNATTTVPNLAGDLWESMPAVWQRMRTASYIHGQVVVVGFSNGCIAATEWSLRYPDRVRALLLCSGTPAADQVQAVAAGWRSLPPTIMTVGDQEPLFLPITALCDTTAASLTMSVTSQVSRSLPSVLLLILCGRRGGML